MVEITNDIFFKAFYEKFSLDEVMDAVGIGLSHNLQLLQPKNILSLIDKLYQTGIVQDDDSFMIASAKAQTLSTYCQEHIDDCYEAVVGWNEGGNQNG